MDYRTAYRAAFNFHEAHNPPVIDREYWRTHRPGADDTPQLEMDYWERVVSDMYDASNRFNNDPFLIDLLLAVCDELDRGYKAARQAAAG